MIYRTRLANLVAILLRPRGGARRDPYLDVAEVFSNADGTIQFVEFVDAGITGPKSTSAAAAPRQQREELWLVRQQRCSSYERKALPRRVADLPEPHGSAARRQDHAAHVQLESDTAVLLPAGQRHGQLHRYDSCPFTAIPTNGVGSFNCETNVNQTHELADQLRGHTGSVIASLAPGLIDNFSNGSTQNWWGSQVRTRRRWARGAGDRYLQITTPGGPLSAENESHGQAFFPRTPTASRPISTTPAGAG
jgi:hypothetical protein